MNLQTIALREEHVPFVHELVRENEDALHSGEYTLSEWRKALLAGRSDETNFIVLADGAPAAWLKLNGLDGAGTAWLSMLVVRKAYQRQGVGSYAVRFAEIYAHARGFRCMRIHTTIDNTAALRCYARLGYRVVKKTRREYTLRKTLRDKYVFRSARLGFRMFRGSDAKALYQNHSGSDYRRWFPNESYADAKEARGAIRLFRGLARKKALPCVLAVELLESRALIGDVGLNAVWDNSGRVEIGYSICEAHRGQGYATEAVAAMSDFAAAALAIADLHGRVMAGNEASCKVLLKSGFTYQGTELGAPDDPYGKGMLIYTRNIMS